MKKSLVGIICLAALVIVSCQKEIDWSEPAAADLLLVKVRSMTGTDSTVVTYSYDGSRRLIKETTVGAQGANILDATLTINRNGSGIITTTVQKSVALAAAGIDSIITTYHYNTSTNRYTSSVFSLSFGPLSVTDSALYTYDGSGRIVSDLHYLGAPPLIPPYQALQDQYTYSANGLNLIKIDQLAAQNPGDPLSGVSTETFTFDAKTNPLQIKNESILLQRFNGYSVNNSKKDDYANTIDPTQNFTDSIAYKYNTANKPDSSYATRGTTVTASKYFYQ